MKYRNNEERKPYDYRLYDLIPAVGAIIFYHRTLLSDIRGEISGLKENIDSFFNVVTITAYQMVSIDLINKLISGEGVLERLIKDL